MKLVYQNRPTPEEKPTPDSGRAELFSGVRGQDEINSLEIFISAFEILAVDADLAKTGGFYRRNYHHSHNVGLADAIIAASAEKINATLITVNVRHFQMLSSVEAPYQRE
jgi:predicted nucleic acid-binding protein